MIQYAVCHLERGSGNDAGMSSHIERRKPDGKTFIPDNADPERTHLNRELLTFPEGVPNRTAVIQHRLDNAGLKRKISDNQTRAIRVMLTGTHEQMMELEREKRLDRWIEANIRWLRDTFGAENLVSCVLHMDEKTPHLHATVVPIVTTPRKRREREGAKKYKEKEPGPRLSADDVMKRDKLRQYQDTYAEAMAEFGLARGVVASGARHLTQQQHNRLQAIELQSNIDTLMAEIAALNEKKERARSEAEDGRQRILSWIGRGELPKLEKELKAKESEVATLKRQMADLQKQMADAKTTFGRERAAFQREIDAAVKRADEWQQRAERLKEANQKLHREAYPERYQLSSGAELVHHWIPNRMYPHLSITTLFHGIEFKATSYKMTSEQLERYESGQLTPHELVNELFAPEEQVSESQHHLLAAFLQTAAGGIPQSHVGTGAGGSTSDLPWRDKDEKGFKKRR